MKHKAILLLTVSIFTLVFFYANKEKFITKKRQLKNSIFIVPTGLGAEILPLPRKFVNRERFSFDGDQKSTVSSRSSDNAVTDTGAGATAFSCGIKTKNGHIGLNSAGRPCKSILEEAKEKGLKVGVVTITELAHPIIGAFTSHVNSPNKLDDIAAQQITKGIDLLIGGGTNDYLPKSQGGTRNDNRNIFNEARNKYGYNVLRNRRDFLRNQKLPLLGNFNIVYLPWEVDRDRNYENLPLSEYTKISEGLLRKACLADPKCPGYLMLVVPYLSLSLSMGDPRTFIEETLEYNRVYEAASAISRRFRDTLVVSASNFQAVRMNFGRNWEPSRIRNQVNSGIVLRRNLVEPGANIRAVYNRLLKINDLTNAEVRATQQRLDDDWRPRGLLIPLTDRAKVHYSPVAGTSPRIPVYSVGPNSHRFNGISENTDVNARIKEYIF